MLINNGASVTLVAKYLGHTKVDETLNTYSHMFHSKLDELVNTINQLNSSQMDKKEMHIDFDKNNYTTVQEFIDDIVYDNNYYRPSFALNYKTPIEYRTQLGFK